jgi:hypothetical protein
LLTYTGLAVFVLLALTGWASLAATKARRKLALNAAMEVF